MNRRISSLFFILLTILIVYSSQGSVEKLGTGEVVLFSNSLNKTITNAIDSAQKSVVLSVYAVTDKRVIAALNRKVEAGLKVALYTDSTASWPGMKYLHDGIEKHLWKKGALMHQKILIIDNQEIYLGSANFTWNSLNLHRNLVIGFQSEDAAEFIKEHLEEKKPPSNIALQFGEQKAEITMLPAKGDPSKKVVDMIKSAKKCIKVAMYTWTRGDFADELTRAKRRGVDVEVALDRNVASSPVIDMLAKAKIKAHMYQGPGLLHHKFIWVDDDKLLCGSANWTKAAFTQNREATILLDNLTEAQQEALGVLWKELLEECKPLP